MELSEGDVRTSSKGAKGCLPLSGREIEEDFLFVGRFGELDEKSYEALNWSVALHVRAPGKELSASGYYLSRHVVSPDHLPLVLHNDLLVPRISWYAEGIQDFFH